MPKGKIAGEESAKTHGLFGSKATARDRTSRAYIPLEDLLQKRGVSQRQLIRETGLPGHLVGRMARDQLSELPLYAIVPLMEFFNLKPNELFAFTEEPLKPLSPPKAKES